MDDRSKVLAEIDAILNTIGHLEKESKDLRDKAIDYEQSAVALHDKANDRYGNIRKLNRELDHLIDQMRGRKTTPATSERLD